MKVITGILAFLILVAVGIQLVPVDRANPPVEPEREISTDPAIVKIFKRSCYDCHSNETVWPWYSHYAPVSWVVAHHVEEGRKYLNFSSYRDLTDPKKKDELLEDIDFLVSRRRMPLLLYTWQHPKATLSYDEMNAVQDWVKKERAKLKTGN